jgi:adenylate cyclase
MAVPAAARKRTDLLRLVFAVVPPLTHVGQAGLFFSLADPRLTPLGWLSVAALGWFAGCWALRWRGHPWLAAWGTWLEVLGHSAVLHLAFGAGAWLAAYPLVLSAASLALFPSDEARSRRAAFALALGAGLAEVALPVVPWIAIDPLALRAYGALNGATAVACGLVFVLAMVGATERAEAEAEVEHARAESLLRNVLPPSVADRLKRHPEGLADAVDDVTVLFADLVGFTPMAASRPAAEVVAVLDRAFSRFDAIVAAHGLEKIKTIGDAYLAVAGLPDPHPDGPAAAASAALALVESTRELSAELGVDLRLRVGLHTGPVVAGVIGTARKAYDLWGDTVNTASRMESHGEPGRVHVTAETAARLRGRFPLTARGAVAVKGKGELQTWWVEPGGR